MALVNQIRPNYAKDVVVDISKDRVKLAYDSEIQVEVLTERQVEKILYFASKGGWERWKGKRNLVETE